MTVQGVLDALGFQLHVTARGHECDASAPGNRFQSASINNEQHTITLTVLESVAAAAAFCFVPQMGVATRVRLESGLSYIN